MGCYPEGEGVKNEKVELCYELGHFDVYIFRKFDEHTSDEHTSDDHPCFGKFLPCIFRLINITEVNVS